MKPNFEVICEAHLEENTKIKGTGTCFYDTPHILKWLLEKFGEKEVDTHVRLCHGVIKADDVGEIAHSWIEYKDSVYEGAVAGEGEGISALVRFPPGTLKHYKEILYVVKYTTKELVNIARNSGNMYGPWDPIVIGKLLMEEILREDCQKSLRD